MRTHYRITKNKVRDLWRIERAKTRDFAGQQFIDGWEPVSPSFHSVEEANIALISLKHDDDLQTWVPVL
jgi:hypothetical protein